MCESYTHLICPFSIQGREHHVYDFTEGKIFNVCLHSDICRSSCFKFGLMIETAKLYISMSVWMTLTFIRGHCYIRNQELRCPFSRKLKIDSDEIQSVATTCWFVEAHARFILHNVVFKGGNSADVIL